MHQAGTSCLKAFRVLKCNSVCLRAIRATCKSLPDIFLHRHSGLTESEAANLQEKLDWLNAIMQDELHIIQKQVVRHAELKSLLSDRARGRITFRIVYFNFRM